MKDKSEKRYCTVDHTNKQSEVFGFDPYQFWLKQARRETAMRREDGGAVPSNQAQDGASGQASTESDG